jgi:hypothetical protein
MGPIDVIVIGYPPDAPRTGEAIPLFIDLVDRGLIRVLDVLIVEKDTHGNVTGIEVTDFAGEGESDLLLFEGARSGLLGHEDAMNAGEALDPGAMALLICIENRWAAPFANAVRRNGGQVLGFERVAVQDLLAAAEALDDADAPV